MYSLTLELDSSNDSANRLELVRLLQELADRVAVCPGPLEGQRFSLRDANGNSVGAAHVTADDPDGEWLP